MNELERMLDEVDKELERMIQEEKELGIISCIIFDNEVADLSLNYFKASFSLKKDELKEYVYVDKLDTCKKGCEDEYLNRTYKLIRMEGEDCAIFYKEY